jgi:hypothetical protein
MDLQEAKTHAHGTLQLTEQLQGHHEELTEFTEQLHSVVQSPASGAAMDAQAELSDLLDTVHEKSTELINALNAVSI